MHVLSHAADDPGCQPQIERRSITLGGYQIRYLFAGSGPDLVLLHGLWGYSFSWRLALPRLARHASVYAVDMLGTGFSDRPPNLDYRLAASAARLLQLLDALEIGHCDLIGSSYGGATAMLAAAQHPEHFHRLVLVSPVNPWSAHGRQLATLLHRPLIAPIVLKLGPRLTILYEVYLRRLFGDSRRIRPGTLEGYMKATRLPGSLDYGLGVLRSWNEDLSELRAALPLIAHIPALLIWGSRDAAVDPASAVRVKQQFRNCRLLMFDGVGHLPYEEGPEQFNAAVVEFLWGIQ